MLHLHKIHHAALICSDYEASKNFYVTILGLTVLQEIYRKERDSYQLDLALGENFCIELFSFPNPPKRVSHPEASGLWHLAFEVDDIDATRNYILSHHLQAEEIRMDTHTNKRFFFVNDPDALPVEFYEA